MSDMKDVEEKMVSVSTYLTSKESELLKKLARLEQRSLSNMIKILIMREAIKEGILDRDEVMSE